MQKTTLDNHIPLVRYTKSLKIDLLELSEIYFLLEYRIQGIILKKRFFAFRYLFMIEKITIKVLCLDYKNRY